MKPRIKSIPTQQLFELLELYRRRLVKARITDKTLLKDLIDEIEKELRHRGHGV